MVGAFRDIDLDRFAPTVRIGAFVESVNQNIASKRIRRIPESGPAPVRFGSGFRRRHIMLTPANAESAVRKTFYLYGEVRKNL